MPLEVREALEFHAVTRIEEVLQLALVTEAAEPQPLPFDGHATH